MLSVILLGGRAFGRLLGHEGSTFMNVISPFIKDDPESLLDILPYENTIRSLQPGRGPLPNKAAIMISHSLPPELWEINFYYL